MDFVILFNRTDGQDTAVINGEVCHIGPKDKVRVERSSVDMGKIGPGIVVYPTSPDPAPPADEA